MRSSDRDLGQARNYHVGAVPAQGVSLFAPVDANDSAEAGAPARFDACQGVLEYYGTGRLRPKPAQSFQEKRRIGLAR